MQIVLNLSEDRLRIYRRNEPEKCDEINGAMISGAQSSHRVIDRVGEGALMGILFAPGGAFPFFNLPLDELKDSEAPLDVFRNWNAADLRLRMLEATPQQKFVALERILLERLEPFTASTGHQFRPPKISKPLRPKFDLVSVFTARHELDPIHPAFREHVGLTPKRFCRIQRFQQALRQIEADQAFAWSKVAVDCGYFDQAHFIHDFRAFAGMSPSAYLDHRTSHRNHVALSE